MVGRGTSNYPLTDISNGVYLYTLPETTIAPENGWLED